MHEIAKGKPLILDSLNFFDTPEETIRSISGVITSWEENIEISLCDTDCDDVIPYILIDTLVRGSPSHEISLNVNSRRVAKATRQLGLSYLGNFCEEVDDADVWPFPVTFGRSHIRGLDNPEIVREIWTAAKEYIATLDSWLKQQGVRMVADFRAQMESLITEVIGNADHAVILELDEDGGDWALTGYMARRSDNGEEEYVCQMSLITLGKTVAQSLSNSRNPWVNDYLEKYKEHSVCGSRLTDDALITAAATHDQVSCRVAGGGNGLTDFLHGFTGAAAAEHKDLSAFVISGHGHVRFCGDYSRTYRTADGRLRQTFNPQDTIYQPPDPNHVYHSDINFPGTIIGVRFYLDEGDLISKIKREEHD